MKQFTKEAIDALVEKYGMGEFINNEIERQQIGYYLASDVCIQELDDLANCTDYMPVYIEATYYDGGKLGALYHLFVPDEWL